MELNIFYRFVWCFALYGTLGWFMESVYVSFLEKKPINRGFLNGPICPIYSFGAIAIIALLRPLKGRYILLFFLGMIVCTALEYVTAVILEKAFQAKWWDYSSHRFNFQGRISLVPSIEWGLGAVALVEFLDPVTREFMEALPPFAFTVFPWVFAAYLLADLSVSLRSVMNLMGRLPKLHDISEKLAALADGGLEFLLDSRDMLGEMVGNGRDKLGDVISDGRERLLTEATKLRESYNAFLAKTSVFQRRVMRSFPEMRSLRYAAELDDIRRALFSRTKKGKKAAGEDTPAEALPGEAEQDAPAEAQAAQNDADEARTNDGAEKKG